MEFPREEGLGLEGEGGLSDSDDDAGSGDGTDDGDDGGCQAADDA